MALFGSSTTYDRARILQAAAKARGRRRIKKAVRLYRRVLMMEPDNAELHHKLAPLLAKRGEDFDAWRSFQIVAAACRRAKNPEKAIAVYRLAADHLSHHLELWLELADTYCERGRSVDAIVALVEGSKHFRSGPDRARAIHLLRRAREIDPWSFEAVLQLARLLSKTDQGGEASMLLQGLAQRSAGRDLRRVRRARFLDAPSLASAWRWLVAPRGPGRASRATGASPVRSSSPRG